MSDEVCDVCGRPVWPKRSGRGPDYWECDDKNGVECQLSRDLTAARQRIAELERALNAIEGYDIDWAKGTGDNVNAIAEIARRSLAAERLRMLKRIDASFDATSPAPVPTVCAPGCGGYADDVPEGLWFLRGIGDGACYCTPACRDAGRPLHPATPGER